MRIMFRPLALVLALAAFLSAALAQDFILPYNKAPETAPEFWAAAKYELQTGNHQRAGAMLQKFAERLANLGQEDQDKLLLAIHDRDGLSPLLRLSNLAPVRALKTTDAAGKEVPLADALIKRMTLALEKRLGDPARIEFFVGNLGKSPEERAYAQLQLRLAGARAVPPLIKALMDQTQAKDHGHIVDALVKMDRDFAPAALAAMDAPSDAARSALIRVFERRTDERIVPYLWWLRGLPDVNPTLKAQADAALQRFLGASSHAVTDARQRLTDEADRWYRRQNDVPEGGATIWRWDPEAGAVVAVPATKIGYEDYMTMYWARKALQVSPAYLPAQVLFLSAAIDRAIAQHGADQPLQKTDPRTAELLAASGAALLSAVLERAEAEGRTHVALGAVRALGESGDPRALRGDPPKADSPLVRALAFPDARVQFAAADAILNIPAAHPAPGASRVVNVLARALASGQRKALVGDYRAEEGQKLAGLLGQAGFDAEAFTLGRQLYQAAGADGGVTLLAIHANLPDPGLAQLLTQLAANPNTSGLPILLFTDAATERAARETAGRFPRVRVVGPVPLTLDLLNVELAALLREADAQPLSDAERKAQGPLAIELLRRIARGEFPGLDARGAEGALIHALASDELAGGAADVLARLPGKRVQSALAEVVLRDVRAAGVRSAVAAGLRLHLARFGILLGQDQLDALARLAASATDPALKEQADRLAAMLQPGALSEGARLLKFPLVSAPPAGAEMPTPNAPADANKEDKPDGL
jgi:DNA-binding response OmpR family regulator